MRRWAMKSSLYYFDGDNLERVNSVGMDEEVAVRNPEAAIQRDHPRHHGAAFDHVVAILGVGSTLLFAYSWVMQNVATTWAAVGAAVAAITSALIAKRHRGSDRTR